MAMPSRYEADTFSADLAAEPKSKGSGCLKGCLIVAVVLLVLAVVLGVVIYQNWRPWYASAMTQVLHQVVDDSDLPAQEKAEVKEHVSRVANEFESGRVSFGQLGVLVQNLMSSPLIPSMQVSVVDQKYLAGSGLPDDEKDAGRQTVRRFVRGMIDGKIPQSSTDVVLPHIATRPQDNQWQLRPTVSDEELRAFLAAAKAEADKAEIPAEPIEFDPSDEIKKLIDAAIAGQ